MARERGITRKTTTVEHLAPTAGDPLASSIREGLKEFARLDVGGFCDAYWSSVSETQDARLDVYKKMRGHFMKVGTIRYGEVDAQDMEMHVMATWQGGVYQLRPIIGNKYYAPSSMQYHVGNMDESGEPGAVREPGIGAAAAAIAELGMVKELKEIKKGLLEGGEGDGMKPGDMQAMMSGMLAPLTTMLESANRRAEAAEQRNHEMQMKMLDMAQNKTAAGGPVWAEMLKLLPKDAVTALLSPPEGPGWMEHAITALREFGPALTQLIVEHFKGAPRDVTPPGALPPARPTETPGRDPSPSPESTGNGAMPLTLSEEQVEAKKMLLDCIREKDFPNAYAMLENFPGFVPTHQGPMPIGPAFLGMVDPTVTRPRIYVIQMMQLAPELRDMMQEADAFIGYVQKRLMADQEAALAAERRADRPDAGPRPSTSGHREEDDRG